MLSGHLWVMWIDLKVSPQLNPEGVGTPTPWLSIICFTEVQGSLYLLNISLQLYHQFSAVVLVNMLIIDFTYHFSLMTSPENNAANLDLFLTSVRGNFYSLNSCSVK